MSIVNALRESCVEQSAASVGISTDSPRAFHTRQDICRITAFRFSYIPGFPPYTISGIANALKLVKEKER